MRKLSHYLETITLLLTSAFLVIASPIQVFAGTPSQQTLNYYGLNGIYYYNPNGGNTNCVTGSNADYSGAQVLDPAVLSAVQANQSFYQQAAEQYGFDWRILAVLHIKEHSAERSNPENGQGAYQLYSYTRLRNSDGSYARDANGKTILDPEKAFLPAGQISDDEFQRQTNIAAEQVANNYAAGLDINTADGIKTMFFRYNGANDRYKAKAEAMGLNPNTGEGSPYVMNKYDARRTPGSPDMDPNWPGMFVGDGEWSSTATTQVAGAYTIYTALGGSFAGSTNECYIVGAGGGRLIPGENGMTLAEAEAFMEAYKNAVRGVSNADLKTLYGMTDNDCTGGIAYNCVSFSRYFINMYTNDYITNHITVGLGNGGDIVKSLISGGYAFTDGGHVPKAYAIFSKSTGDLKCKKKISKEGEVPARYEETVCGHTGVVLGIDTANDKIIIGEAACGDGEAGIKARTITISEAMSDAYTYAYPNSLNFATSSPDTTTSTTYTASSETTTITIPGLTRSYKIAWVSDMHIIADGPTYVGQQRYDMFVNSNGVHSADYWEAVINYLNQGGFNAVVFGGDLADYYSQANDNVIRNGLERLTMPWFYIAGGGDHDLYNRYENPSSSLTNDSAGGAGDVIDLGEVLLVGLNNSSNRNISSELSAVTSKIKNAGKPVILITHVPFESQNKEIISAIKSVHNDQAYLWGPDSSYMWNFGENGDMKAFVDANIYSNDTNVKLVLAGHVHELSHDSSLSASVKQHIFKASFKGPIGIVNIRGN